MIYLGTLSKMVAPGLRVGWVIAAPEMIAALTTALPEVEGLSRADIATMLRSAAAEADWEDYSEFGSEHCSHIYVCEQRFAFTARTYCS